MRCGLPALPVLLLEIGQAHANVCVELDTTQDTLDPSDQRSARALLEQTISNHGIPVARAVQNLVLQHALTD